MSNDGSYVCHSGFVVILCLAGVVLPRGAAHAQLKIPKAWNDKALADWATPVAGFNLRPAHFIEYDPDAARALLRLAGVGPLAFNLTYPSRPRSKEMAEILQEQWHSTLGAEVTLVPQETNVWVQTLQAVAYHGITECSWMPDYVDPIGILELFNGRADGTGWVDPEFRQMLSSANGEADASARLRKLAVCEARLLRGMPILPLFFDTHVFLQKPYIKGLRTRLIEAPDYRNVTIDTHWRPS